MHRRNGDVPVNVFPGFVNSRPNWPRWDTHLFGHDLFFFLEILMVDVMFIVFIDRDYYHSCGLQNLG